MAALWVLGYHYHGHFAATLGGDRAWGWAVESGYLAVDLFFVLSGFVLAHTWADRMLSGFTARQYWEYLWARLARVYPLHILCLAALVVIVAVVGRDSLDGDRYSANGFVMDLTLTRAFFGGSQGWNTPAWSLSAEWLAYLLLPAVAVFAASVLRRGWPAVVTAVVLVVAIQYASAQFAPSINHMPLPAIRVLTAFALGAGLRLALRRANASVGAGWVGVAAGATLIVVPALIESNGVRATIGLTLAVVAIGAAALTSGPVARLLEHPVTVFGGKVSFAVYLVHIPMLMLFVRVFSAARVDGLPQLVLVLLVLGQVAAVVAVSAALYVLVESRAHTYLRKRTPGRQADPASR